MANALEMEAVGKLTVEGRFSLIAAILETVPADEMPFTPDQ